MKSRIGWKGMLVSLSVLIIFIGTFRYAIGNVVFPNTFTAGTPAVASQVNANFAAINARQTASFATLAGDYYVKDLQAWKKEALVAVVAKIAASPQDQYCNCKCTSSFQGTITLTADGKVSGSGIQSQQCACENCCIISDTVTITGTYTANADGSGVITVVFDYANPKTDSVTQTFSYQASKDLNTLMFNATDKNSLGIALRK